MDFNPLFYSCPIKREFSQREVTVMLLGLKWYWWLVILAALAISVPFKVTFLKWWSKREQGKKKGQHGKWGDDE